MSTTVLEVVTISVRGRNHIYVGGCNPMCPGVLARPQLQASAATARLHGSRLPHRARQEPRRVDWAV